MPYDVFLSHNSADKDAVRAIALKLKNKGISCWFDEWCLPVGERTNANLIRGLKESECCAVFFGPSGMGPWHDLEQDLALLLNVEAGRDGRRFGLIPVRLPGAPDWRKLDLPPFLRLFNGSSFSSTEDASALVRLISGIQGPPPGPPAPVDPNTAPYVGMRPFTREDRAIFFGRTGYILDLAEHLRRAEQPRLLFFLGASGSGKSSLLHAGLIPSLESGELLPATFTKVKPSSSSRNSRAPSFRDTSAFRTRTTSSKAPTRTT